jgi:hypothetical protein
MKTYVSWGVTFSMFTIACTHLVIKIIYSVEIYLILITKFAKLIQFWRNILKICQNMYDFGEISLTCLTKYAIFF